jgi:O-antigen/teichoic acid export membrane protein
LVSEALFELVAAFLRAHKEIQLLSVYYFIKTAMRIVILAIGILIFHIGLYQTIMGIVASQIGFILFIYINNIFKKVGLSLSFGNIHWKTVLFFSLPLVPYGILIWANNFVDRYLILHLLDMTQVSIYAVAYSLAAMVGLFYSIIGFTLYPYLAKLWNNGDKINAAETLHKAIEYYLFCSIPFIALLTVLSSPIIKIFSRVEYLSSWQVFLWLGLGIGIFGLYQLNIYSLLLANKTLFNLEVSAVSLFGNFLFNILLIPRIGILGAAIATFLSNSILAYWTIKSGIKYIPYIFPWRATLKIILSTLFMSFVLLIAEQHLEINNLWKLICLLSIGTGIYGAIDLLNKNSFILRLSKNI